MSKAERTSEIMSAYWISKTLDILDRFEVVTTDDDILTYTEKTSVPLSTQSFLKMRKKGRVSSL